MDLSIIIVSWNTEEYLRACLESVYRNAGDLELEVIVVDNASRDGTVDMVRGGFPHVRLIANADNAGFCKANNQGIEIAHGDLLLLLNPDTEVKPCALRALVDFLRTHPEAGVAGPMLLNTDGSIMPNGHTFPTVRRELMGITGLSQRRKAAYEADMYGREDFSVGTEVDVVCGAALLTRREVVERIGGLDEDLFMFYDEVDFCRRVRSAGWRVFYVPESRITHHWMQSVKQDVIRSMRRLFHAQYVYFSKHHGFIPALFLRTMSAMAIAYRASRIRGGAIKGRLLSGLKGQRTA